MTQNQEKDQSNRIVTLNTAGLILLILVLLTFGSFRGYQNYKKAKVDNTRHQMEIVALQLLSLYDQHRIALLRFNEMKLKSDAKVNSRMIASVKTNNEEKSNYYTALSRFKFEGEIGQDSWGVPFKYRIETLGEAPKIVVMSQVHKENKIPETFELKIPVSR